MWFLMKPVIMAKLRLMGVLNLFVFTLLSIVFIWSSDGAAFGRLGVIDTPAEIQTAPVRHSVQLVSSGYEALLAWGQRDRTGSSVTNIFVSHIRGDLSAADPVGRFLLPQFNSGSHFYAIPFGADTFILAFQPAIPPALAGQWVVARLAPDGAPRFTKPLLSKLPAGAPAITSNGKTVLMVFGSLTCVLLDENGVEISRSLGGPAARQVLAVPFLNDYIVIWERGGVARVSGATAGVTILAQPQPSLNVAPTALSVNPGRGEMLASFDVGGIVTNSLLVRMDAQANILDSVSALPVHSRTIRPFKNGWMIFDAAPSQDLTSTFAEVDNEGLKLKPDPFPPVSFEGSSSDLRIEPWHDGRFLLASRTFSPAISVFWRTLGTNGLSERHQLGAVGTQDNVTIAAGADGYLALWEERGNTAELKGIRLHKDGSRVDAAPFTIASASASPGPAPLALFNGKEYVVAWHGPGPGGNVQMNIQFVAPLPSNTTSSPPVFRPLNGATLRQIFRHHGETWILNSTGNSTTSTVIVSDDRSVRSGPTINGESYVSNGEKLYWLRSGPAYVSVQAIPVTIDPNPVYDTSQSIDFGPGADLCGIASGDNFLVTWRTPALMSAVFSGGAILRTNRLVSVSPANTNITINAFLGANADGFLISALELVAPAASIKDQVFRLDLTGIVLSTNTQVLPFTTNRVSIASAGADFLSAETVWKLPYRSVAVTQWISGAEPGRFALPTLETNEAVFGLTLDPARTYRVEESDDLLNWTETSRLTASDSVPLRQSVSGTNHFYRVVLDPK